MRAFTFILLVVWPCLALANPARASAESEAFSLFEQACLHDEGQFDTATAMAASRKFRVAPKPLRDSLVRKGEGAAWLAQSAPFVLLHANVEAGCGLMLKPADDAGFSPIIEALEGAEIASDDSFESSWTRWYVLDHSGRRGVLMTGLMDVSESKSAFLRYIPAAFVLEHAESMTFLLMDVERFRKLRAILKLY